MFIPREDQSEQPLKLPLAAVTILALGAAPFCREREETPVKAEIVHIQGETTHRVSRIEASSHQAEPEEDFIHKPTPEEETAMEGYQEALQKRGWELKPTSDPLMLQVEVQNELLVSLSPNPHMKGAVDLVFKTADGEEIFSDWSRTPEELIEMIEDQL